MPRQAPSPGSFSVTFAGYDIAEIATLTLRRLRSVLEPFVQSGGKAHVANPEKTEVTRRITGDLTARLDVLLNWDLAIFRWNAASNPLSWRTAASAPGDSASLQPFWRDLYSR